MRGPEQIALREALLRARQGTGDALKDLDFPAIPSRGQVLVKGQEKVRVFRVIGGNRRLCPFLELISVPCRGIRSPNAMEVGPVRGTSIMGAQLKVCQLRVLFDYSHKGRSPV